MNGLHNQIVLCAQSGSHLSPRKNGSVLGRTPVPGYRWEPFCVLGVVMARMIFISRKQTKPGFVYVIKSRDGLSKIGITIDPRERLESLNRQYSGDSLEIERLYRVSNMRKYEKALHEYFSEKRIYGEWFDLSNSDLSDFDNIVSRIGASNVMG